MVVKIRLQQHGCRNHPLWWIVVQGGNKPVKGRYIEKIGEWRPRNQKTYDRSYIINVHRANYWIANGAQFGSKVRRILEKYELLPKKPPTFGTKYLYPRKEKTYPLKTTDILKRFKNDPEVLAQELIEEEINLLKRRKELVSEAFEGKEEVKDISQMNTTDIESDEKDIFERKRNFDEIKRRFDMHRDHALLHTNTNDYRYNMYLRKLNKLSQSRFGGIDLDGYKDYLTNLAKIAGLDQDWTEPTAYKFGEKFGKPADPDGNTQDWGALSFHGSIEHELGLEEISEDMPTNEKLDAQKRNVLKILENELIILKSHNAKYALENRLKSAANPLDPNHEEARRSVEDQVIEQELISRLDKKSVTSKKQSELKNYVTQDFLDNYDQQEEEVTQMLSDLLIDHPYLMEKIRHLQVGNRLLNPYEGLEDDDLNQLEVAKAQVLETEWFEEQLKDETLMQKWAKARSIVTRLRELDKHHRITRGDISKTLKRLTDSYRKMMADQGKEIDITSELDGPSRILKYYGVDATDDIDDIQRKHDQKRQLLADAGDREIDTEGPWKRDEFALLKFHKKRVLEQYEREQKKLGKKAKKEEPKEEEKVEAAEGEEGEAAEGEVAEGEEAADTPKETMDPELRKLLKEERDRRESVIDEVWKEFREKREHYYMRYLPGYRHYESYNHYKLKYPDRTIEEYHKDVNREITYSEFRDMFKQYVRMQMDLNPLIKKQVMQQCGNNLHLFEAMMNQPDFEHNVKQLFDRSRQQCKQNDDWFRYVQALEMLMDQNWIPDDYPQKDDKVLYHQPTNRPVIALPNILDDIAKAQPLNKDKLGALDTLNPLKTHLKSNYIIATKKNQKYFIPNKFKRFKKNRIFRTSSRFYSTLHVQNYSLGYFGYWNQ